MSSPPFPRRREDAHQASQHTGRGTRIPELSRLLAIHGARQIAGPTAKLMREGDLPRLDGNEPARMMMIFTNDLEEPNRKRCAAGAFNKGIANLLDRAK